MIKSTSLGRMYLGQSVALAPTDHTEDIAETVAEWAVSCEIGCFIPDDGDAFWAVEYDCGSCKQVFVSDQSAFNWPAPSWATHAFFYGK